jgi:adenylosuccinate synthase
MNKLKIEPVYKSFEGWQTDISAIGSYEKLPVKTKEYVNYINEFLQVPVKYISNGPGRDQIVIAE